jgi:6,7-dimethyl-8-ribityllumazine synthase
LSREIRGRLDGRGLRIAIVVARFNESVTTRLLTGAKAALADNGVHDGNVTVSSVPGSFEIPLTAKKMVESGSYDAVVCLGAVIRGETDHYEHIARQAAEGIAQVGLTSGVPVVFGVLTTNTVEQAEDRSGGPDGKYAERPLVTEKQGADGESAQAGGGNSGYNAGLAAIEMANLLREMGVG